MRKSSKKRPYRAFHLGQFKWDALFERVKDRRIVFSVDIAKEAMVAGVMDEDESVLKTVRWSHPLETDLLLEFLEGLRENATDVAVAMEPSGVYGDALRWQLHEASFEVFRVSPKKSHDMSEIYDGVPSSHDGKSAAIIGVLHLQGASDPWPPESEQNRELTAALQLVRAFGKQFRQNLSRLEALTARHWPELALSLELSSATALELLAAFGGPAAVVRSSDEARALMKRIGRSKLASKKIDAVLLSAEGSTGVPLIPEEDRLVRVLAAETRRQQQELRQAQRRVGELSTEEGSTRELAPVVGKTTAAVIVAGVGDPLDFASPQALTKAAGLNLREHSSGKQKGGLHITKRGSGEARMYLWMAALRLIQSDPVIKAWYAKKVKRQGGQAKPKALVAVMRKLMLGLWHVARGKPFDSTKLFDVRRLNLAGDPR